MVTGGDSQSLSPADRFAVLWGEIVPEAKAAADGDAPPLPDVFGFVRPWLDAPPEQRLEIFLIDLKERSRLGVMLPFERYLEADPGLAADQDAVSALAYGEFCAHLERGEEFDLNEFEARVEAVAHRPTGLFSPSDMTRITETHELAAGSFMDTEAYFPASDLEGTLPAAGEVEDAAPTQLDDVMPTLPADDAGASLGFSVVRGHVPSGLPDDPGVDPNGRARFAIREELGSGGMGIVYRAFDGLRGEDVALKTMRRVDPLSLLRFKQEFRVLSGVDHPNLVNLHELIAVGDVWFFTMELVDGVDLVSHVRTSPEGRVFAPGEALDDAGLERLREAGRQLVQGVSYLHEVGKLHRDLKPRNVLVAKTGRVVLLDFGLTADLGHAGFFKAAGAKVVGTVAYMSPEQARGDPLRAASDWYGVGVILYEALTGKLPFDAPSKELLHTKVNRDAPRASTVASGVPEGLDELCNALLQRDPLARPTGPSLLSRLSCGASDDDGCNVATHCPGGPLEHPLVGRQRHWAALDSAFQSVKAGRPVMLLVSGRSGSGKSTLIHSFLNGIKDRKEAIVLSGRCYERESVPYKALDTVVDSLSRYLKGLSSEQAQAILPADVGLLARMFPVLKGVDAVEAAEGETEGLVDRQELRRRATHALRQLLGSIARRRTLVIAIDDLHWGDEENALLFEELFRSPGAPPLFLVGTFRTEDGEASPLIRALRASKVFETDHDPTGAERLELAVGELTLAESRELALALLGSDDPVSRVEAHGVARESRGNPFFIDELVKHIRTGGGLAGGRRSVTQRLDLDEVLWGRVCKLVPQAKRLLEVVAVSGRPVRLADACKAADLDPVSSGRMAAAVLRGARFVRGTGRPELDEVEPYHDTIRETVVRNLVPDQLAGLHLRLGLVLDEAGHADEETLAVHFEGGNRPDWAARHYAKAADKAFESLAFYHAAGLYRLALRHWPREGNAECLGELARLKKRVADSLASAGHVNEAASEYIGAADCATGIDAIDLRRRAAMQLLLGGKVEEGFEILRSVLRLRGLAVPRGGIFSFAALATSRLRLRARGLHFRQRDVKDVPADELSMIDLYWSAGAGLTHIDLIRGAAFQTRGLLRALKAGEPYRVARALTLESATVAMAGVNASDRAARLIDRADQLAENLHQPHLDGLIALARGIAAIMVGRWRDALGWFDTAEPIFRNRCSGVAWELNTLHNLTFWSLTHMGNLNRLRERWPVLLHEAQVRGDVNAETNLRTYYMAMLRLAGGESRRARAELDDVMKRWSPRGYHIQHSSALRASVALSLYERDAKGASERVNAEWPTFRRSLQYRVQLLRVQLLELRGRCALAAADDTADTRPLLDLAERCARALEREGVSWARAHATLLRSGLSFRRGELKAAGELMLVAAESYKTVDMNLFSLVARRRAGELLTAQESLVQEADQALAAQGVCDPNAFSMAYIPWGERPNEPSTLSDDRLLVHKG